MSLPLHGADARLGRDLLRGAELALERPGAPPLSLVVGDAADAAANADRAAADPEAVAYLGEVRSAAVAATQPALARAGLLQLAPLATARALAGPTLLRLCADDGEIAFAIAAWLGARGARRVLVVHDPDEAYGAPMGELCADAADAHGLEARRRRVWEPHEPVDPDIEGADAVVFAGVAGAGARDLWHALHTVQPRMWLVGTEGLAQPWLARTLDPGAADRTRVFCGQRASASLHGAEALGVVLDAVRDGARSRRDVREHALARAPHWLARTAGVVAVEAGELLWELPAVSG